jgi:hypothetical protein
MELEQLRQFLSETIAKREQAYSRADKENFAEYDQLINYLKTEIKQHETPPG